MRLEFLELGELGIAVPGLLELLPRKNQVTNIKWTLSKFCPNCHGFIPYSIINYIYSICKVCCELLRDIRTTAPEIHERVYKQLP